MSGDSRIEFTYSMNTVFPKLGIDRSGRSINTQPRSTLELHRIIQLSSRIGGGGRKKNYVQCHVRKKGSGKVEQQQSVKRWIGRKLWDGIREEEKKRL